MAVMADKTNSMECRIEGMTNCLGLIKFNSLASPNIKKRPVAGKSSKIYCFLSIDCILNYHISRREIISSRLI